MQEAIKFATGKLSLPLERQEVRIMLDIMDVLYVIVGLGVFCVIVKWINNRMYKRLILAAEQMGKSEHPLMKMLLNKLCPVLLRY